MCAAPQRNFVAVTTIVVWSTLVVGQMTLPQRGHLRLTTQLGSPITVDEAELTSEGGWARITNQSDGVVSSVTLGFFVGTKASVVRTVLAEPYRVDNGLTSGGSVRLPKQVFRSVLASSAETITIFVARVSYEDGHVYQADIPAMKRELFNNSE